LSGQPISGPDIGGYEKVATPDLFGNWISLGAFYPFARAHKAKGMPNQEAWEFGAKIEAVARTALTRRYRLLPYLYTLFRESSVDGIPVMRPVFFADPADATLRKEQQAFLVGGDLLVVPRWAKRVALPREKWRETHLLGGSDENDGFQPAVRIRPGAAIPLSEPIQHTGEYDLGTLTLLVSPDKNGDAEGWLYEDAGDGFAYKQGHYALTHFRVHQGDRTIRVAAEQTEGDFPPHSRRLTVRLVTDGGELVAAGDFAGSAELRFNPAKP
jgi:alpha-glucosidase